MALGRPTLAATGLWIAAVTHYVEQPAHDADSIGWLRGAVLVCTELDPRWEAPTRYGALMLASLGDVDGSEEVLEDGARRHPGEVWYPAALGMSRYLHRGDAEGAARWLTWAARIEGASPIYGRAAARLGAEAGEQAP